MRLVIRYGSVIVTVVWHDYHSTLSFNFAKSNSSSTPVDLIFLLILSIHVTLILSYPYIFTLLLTSFLIFLSNMLVISMMLRQGQRRDLYLLVRRRTVFLGQLKGDLGPDQFVRQHLDLLLDGHKTTWNREISGPTTWEVTSARVQKHSLSTMLSRRADNDSFSSSNALTLNSDRSIRSFKASISAR